MSTTIAPAFAPGATVLLHGVKRTIEHVALHPTGTMVVFKRKAFARRFYPLHELVREGAEFLK